MTDEVKYPFPFLAGSLWRSMLALIVISLVSCREDDETLPAEPIVNEENRYVNEWIMENMEEWYLWNDDLPANVDLNLEPEEYFAGLLADGDRFSWIQPDYEELLNSLKGVNREAGYEFVLYRQSETSDKVVAQILYVKPGTPAEAAGLQRGDVISRINGQAITTGNYQTLLSSLKENHSLTFKPAVPESETFGPESTVQLSVVEYSENPNYLHKIIEDGDHRIGYYVYNFFAAGASEGSADYDDEMDQIFSVFKNENITDLVLDLRFNSGGSETSAKNLASQIGPGISSADLFFNRVYNDEVTAQIESSPELGPDFLKSFFQDEASNVGNQLRNNRVYILTSSRTASASELIINGLEPYMDVFLIGDVTYGKNVGSISIYEENDPKNTWGLQPIVVKVSNSAGFSEYGDGFIPDIENRDNSLFIYPLGDERENLLAAAIAHIKGVAEPGRVSASSLQRSVLGHSLDLKRRGFNLFLEPMGN
jgi:C-terminal processing protease CtpA/Prc